MITVETRSASPISLAARQAADEQLCKALATGDHVHLRDTEGEWCLMDKDCASRRRNKIAGSRWLRS